MSNCKRIYDINAVIFFYEVSILIFTTTELLKNISGLGSTVIHRNKLGCIRQIKKLSTVMEH